MRPKFRQWNNVTNKWHYWGYVSGEENVFTSPIHGESYQFTGLQDKNGVDIYEGDIVKDTYDRVYSVSFICGAFGVEDKIGDQDPFSVIQDPDYEYEVIGNIHENTDLLQ